MQKQKKIAFEKTIFYPPLKKSKIGTTLNNFLIAQKNFL